MSLSICIPAYREPYLLSTLESLKQCSLPQRSVQVVVFINCSENDEEQVKKESHALKEEVGKWISNYEGALHFECLINTELPKKKAGVGLARKVLGDYVSEQYPGVLAYLDADCTVSENYLKEIEDFFQNASCQAAAIHFEHQIDNTKTHVPILEYELHLRYYIAMQDWLALPFAFHTVGSSMAVTTQGYTARGGMNTRKAGEDFYFLQKFCKDQVVGKITKATVYPSARESTRVPFGTGRAMLAYQEEGFSWKTYNPQSFELLRPFIKRVPLFYEGGIDFEDLDSRVKGFLESIETQDKIEKIKVNSKSLPSFEKSFFQFFDAFKLMKYLHFMRDVHGIQDVPLQEATNWYALNVLNREPFEDLMKALCFFRERDRS